LLPSLAEKTAWAAKVGDEATLLYGESGGSSVTRVAEVTAVAAVDIDELVSFLAGGEVPSDET
jgi:hypothetical protein